LWDYSYSYDIQPASYRKFQSPNIHSKSPQSIITFPKVPK
jgi:hypothetical protein